LLAARNFRIEGEKGLRPLWLSAVVLEELLVGATGHAAQKLCLKLEKDFTRAGRLFVPSRSDWITGGRVLCEIGKKHGFDQVKVPFSYLKSLPVAPIQIVPAWSS
jgi:predicted nucleic acid-binding protein